jgi:hypothetical protein
MMTCSVGEMVVLEDDDDAKKGAGFYLGWIHCCARDKEEQLTLLAM